MTSCENDESENIAKGRYPLPVYRARREDRYW